MRAILTGPCNRFFSVRFLSVRASGPLSVPGATLGGQRTFRHT